jgi:hypothetical protein
MEAYVERIYSNYSHPKSGRRKNYLGESKKELPLEPVVLKSSYRRRRKNYLWSK